MTNEEEMQIRVPSSKIEGIRRLKPIYRQIPAVHIVNMILDEWINERTLQEKP